MDEVLRSIQLTELEILSYVDQFCRDNNIHYSLSGGTLLGAVRHHGFIPWDDDVDIMMLREDYDRFQKLWDEKADKSRYFLQTKDIEPKFSQSFLKIRKNNTLFLQEGEHQGDYHNGIFIDIMPADRFPSKKILQLKYYADVFLYQLFTREFAPEKNGIVMKLGSQILLRLTNHSLRKKLRKHYLKQLMKYNADEKLEIISTETVTSMKRHYSASLMKEFIEIDFEGKRLQCSAKWEEILTTCYGDYMKLPPEEEQTWKHRPVGIEFE